MFKLLKKFSHRQKFSQVLVVEITPYSESVPKDEQTKNVFTVSLFPNEQLTVLSVRLCAHVAAKKSKKVVVTHGTEIELCKRTVIGELHIL
jgi:hypothetical protein